MSKKTARRAAAGRHEYPRPQLVRDNWTSLDGTWERIWRTFLSQLDAEGKLEWAQAFLDGSFVPAKKGAME